MTSIEKKKILHNSGVVFVFTLMGAGSILLSWAFGLVVSEISRSTIIGSYAAVAVFLSLATTLGITVGVYRFVLEVTRVINLRQ